HSFTVLPYTTLFRSETIVPARRRAQSAESYSAATCVAAESRPTSSSQLSSWPSFLPSPCWLSNSRVSPRSEYIHAKRNYKQARTDRKSTRLNSSHQI